MKKLSGIILTLFVIGLLAGCSGGVSKEDAGKIWDSYINAKIEQIKAGNTEANDAELQDKAAKDGGFENWKNFVEDAGKSLSEDWAKLTIEKTTLMGQKISEAATSEDATEE